MKESDNYLKTVVAFAAAALFSFTARAQVDSSYHNYLYDSRTEYFTQLPTQRKPVVFFGDSITHWGDWAELTGWTKALNRGIAGDNTFGLLGRLEEVLRHQPTKIFILIGTNDINRSGEKAIPYICNNYGRIIGRVKAVSPRTRVYIQSIFPINNQLINPTYYKGNNEIIGKANAQLRALAKQLDVPYIDVYSALLDGQGQLAAGYTYDGLHLSGKGYRKWVEMLKTQKLL